MKHKLKNLELIIDGVHLQGQAMPEELRRFQKQVEGKKIVRAGYEYREASDWSEASVWPVLVLEDDTMIFCQRDDEGNGPGSLVTCDKKGIVTLCETQPAE